MRQTRATRASLNLKRDKRDKRDFRNVSYLICLHYEKHKKVAEEIDAIKGPLYAHGIAIYMRRMGIVSTSRNSEGVRLGIGPTLVVVVPFNASIGQKISAFLRMSPVLLELPSLARFLVCRHQDDRITGDEKRPRSSVHQDRV